MANATSRLEALDSDMTCHSVTDSPVDCAMAAISPILVTMITRPYVLMIRLPLPAVSRRSVTLARQYIDNIPRDAKLLVTMQNMIGKPTTKSIQLSQLTTFHPKWWKLQTANLATFQGISTPLGGGQRFYINLEKGRKWSRAPTAYKQIMATIQRNTTLPRAKTYSWI